MATADTVRQTFHQVLGTDPIEAEEAEWVARLEAATDRGEASDDLVETLLLKANDTRSILHLQMTFFDRRPDDDLLDAWLNRYNALRLSDPHLTQRRALIVTIGGWLASERGRHGGPFEFSEEDFRSILFLKLL